MARSKESRLKTYLLKYKQEAEKANCKRLVAFKASNLPLLAHSSSKFLSPKPTQTITPTGTKFSSI